MKLHTPDADGPCAECNRPLASFGLTERQARFLVTVMRHSGVFVGRQYAAFAGITHGQKVHDFIETLLVRRFARPIELGTTGRTRIFHVHYKPLYAAIGEPDNRNRRRVTIDRTIRRLMVLDAVLADRSVVWLGSEHEKRYYFIKRLGESLRDNEYPRLMFGEPPNVTVRYFPDKLPIGYEPDRYRHVFLYLARSPSPVTRRSLTPQLSACERESAVSTSTSSSALLARHVSIHGSPEIKRSRSVTHNLHPVAGCDRGGHHALEHRAVLGAVQV